MKRLLVTGSSGLIGSEVVSHFSGNGWEIHGVDNNMRADFFGPQGDTSWNTRRLQETLKNFRHHTVDIRDRPAILNLVSSIQPNAIVHTAAQPSHDLAASRPFDDFDVNAGGTLNLLEAARRSAAEAPFVHMSTNKVYGDAPGLWTSLSAAPLISGQKMNHEYINQNRKGDHICYISDLSKMKGHYPNWGITKDLKTTFIEIYESWLKRNQTIRRG